MYADLISESMQIAIDETARRRKIQEEYNKKYGIVPKTIIKEIRDLISSEDIDSKKKSKRELSSREKANLLEKLTKEMKTAAKELDFERAMELRDIIFEMESE